MASAFLVTAQLSFGTTDSNVVSAHGLTAPVESKAYLFMPDHINGNLPRLLSQTGAFKDTRTLTPAENLIPYNLNVAFWSDGASKSRWVSLPKSASSNQKIEFAPIGEWKCPNGTVFVKHFEIGVDETNPKITRRLETRLLVRDASGSVYGVTYKWRADNSDADLLTTNLTEEIPVKTATGTKRRTWYYPSREDCRVCHTDLNGGVLGVNARQLHGDFPYPNGVVENQLRAWNHAGLFQTALSEAEIAACPKLAHSDDTSRSLEDRARSYLDANCAHCHRPKGTVAYFDARYQTPLAEQNLIEGQVLLDEGLDNPHIVTPNDIWRSILFMRASATDAIKMPPLAHQETDRRGMALLRQWIESLPGPPVLPPPTFSPAGGDYSKPVEVTLSDDDPAAVIRYTLDGSRPTASDAVYDRPIKLTGPATIRAKAFKKGFVKSITTQQTFVISN